MTQERRSGAAGYDTYAFVAAFYDHVVPYKLREDVSFFVDMARESGGPVLEVGSGTGRVLIPTARAGIEIVGLDLSESMLEICRKRLADEPPQVSSKADLVAADMRDFDLGRRFALVTMPFRPFQHLVSVEEQISCLRSVHRHLGPAGRFVVDLFNPSLPHLTQDSYLEEWGDEPEFTMTDGRRVIRKHRIVARNHATQVSDCELIYYVTHPDGRKERLVHSFPMRYTFRYEMEHLLVRCGFAIEAVYGDHDRRPFGSAPSPELIFVVRPA